MIRRHLAAGVAALAVLATASAAPAQAPDFDHVVLLANEDLFAGYNDSYQGDHEIGLTQSDRTVFLKVGYSWAL